MIDAGFRVVAADLRGYNESSKPPHVSDYRLVTIANDIAALIEEELDEPTVLVGHDWGGLVSWLLAMMRPELLRKLVVLNMPHPVPLVREIHRSTRQKLRLAYQLFFRLPMIPALLMPLILPTVADLGRARSGLHARDDGELRRVRAEPAHRAHRRRRPLRANVSVSFRAAKTARNLGGGRSRRRVK